MPHNCDADGLTCRMVKKAVQRGRSKRGAEAYIFRYVAALSPAITKLAEFFTILLGRAFVEEISHHSGFPRVVPP